LCRRYLLSRLVPVTSANKYDPYLYFCFVSLFHRLYSIHHF
jgi:hypothetical protein